jgi:saccharopine dehydrogenase (NADP+, L-glutamate forming)/spermidine synthase
MNQKNVLILGAGMVAPPVVKYFLKKTDYRIVVADQIYSKAEKLAGNSERTEALKLDINEVKKVDGEISQADAVISLLPYTFHPVVAEYCIKQRKHLITASYVSDSMRKLDERAKAAGIILLNEIGLDPGIDHMEAMRIIHKIKDEGGQIDSFISFCGGLPAPEANTNPLGYKFSWSPLGVLLAGKNQAIYLKNGRNVKVAPEDLFKNPVKINIEGIGELDGYPNRNSLPYIDIYGIQSATTMLRGTLRYKGWCAFIQAAVEIGLLEEESKNWKGFSYESMIRELIQDTGNADIKTALSDFLYLDIDSDVIKTFEWLGLFQKKPLPLESGSALDILTKNLQAKIQYKKGERDMIILQHLFHAKYPDGRGKKITSYLIDFGIPDGDTSMARTVGLPLAIGARLVLEEKIKEIGIQIPVIPQIYRPVLKELNELGIGFKETININK